MKLELAAGVDVGDQALSHATLELVKAGGKRGGASTSTGGVRAVVKPAPLHAEVRRQLTRRRAGTHSTKNRAFVSGGGIKP